MGKKVNEIVYLVYTDVVGSTQLDKKLDPIKWRKDTFENQLKNLLSLKNSLVLKSIGDALFVIYEVERNKHDRTNNIDQRILYYVWKAFLNSKDVKIPIRAVVHQISGHKRGEEIASHLSKIRTCGRKQDLLQALRRDIFGTEVNRAARMLSLVHGSAVLVSHDIIRRIDSEADNKAISGGRINFTHNNQKLVLHSPVPVLYMKGVLGDRDRKPYIVWEMGSSEEPTLAPEFKSNQAFRLISVRLSNPQDLSTQGDKIASETLVKLSVKKPNLSFRFYVDMLWRISDYFIFRDASFERIKREDIDSNNYIKSLTHLVPKGSQNNENIQLDGCAKSLIIKANRDTILDVDYSGRVVNKEFTIPLLALTSFPDIFHGNRIRRFLSREYRTGLFAEIEPQSIQVYDTIKFGKNFTKHLMDDPASNTFSGFKGTACILLTFQLYFGNLKEADNVKPLFREVGQIEEKNGLIIACYGLTAGLTDGFVLYSMQETKWPDGLKSILTKLIGVTMSSNFYYKIYPIAVFILKPVEQFAPLKRNIVYLEKLDGKH